MNVVDTRCEAGALIEECLSEGVHIGSLGSGHNAVQIVIRYHLNELRSGTWQVHEQRQHLVTAVFAATLRPRGADCDAADHHVVNVLRRVLRNQAGEPLVHLRGATRGYGNITPAMLGYRRRDRRRRR